MRANFTTQSLFLITAVVAGSALGLAHLWRASFDNKEIGWFVVVTAMAPLGMMIIASWVYRIFKKPR